MNVLAPTIRSRISAVLSTALFGLAMGCASVNEGVASDEGTARVAQPSQNCSQLLALLSDENKQPLLPRVRPRRHLLDHHPRSQTMRRAVRSKVSDLLHNAVKRNREQS